MVNWAKNTRINSSGYSPAQWVIGRGYKLPWSLLDEKQSGELASLELPEHSPEFSRRMSWLRAARRAFATHGHQSSIETCAVCRCSSQCSHPGDRERRTGVCLAESQEKTETTRGPHLLPISSMVQLSLLAKRRTTCSCLIAVV